MVKNRSEIQPGGGTPLPARTEGNSLQLASIAPTRALHELMALAREGTAESVHALMAVLTPDVGLVDRKNVDYALSLVEREEGIEAIHRVLLEGRPIQRNYAALFFKRRGDVEVLIEAVEFGSIDPEQAWVK